MKLYHAGKDVVEYPEIRITKYTKDFSWGFYCTNIKEQAVRWAKRGNGHGIINGYEYTSNEKLSILRFAEMTDEWLDFIAKCRAGNVHSYGYLNFAVLGACKIQISNPPDKFSYIAGT